MSMRWAVLGVLAVLVVGSTPVGATSQPSGPVPNPENLCNTAGGNEPTVVATTVAPDSGPLSDNGESLYPGTELYLVYCKDGSVEPALDDRLQVDTGVEKLGTGDQYYRVRLTEGATRVDLSALISGASAGPTVTITRGARAQSAILNESIPFRNESAATSYTGAETRYLTAEETVRRNTSRLNGTTEAIADGQLNSSVLERAGGTLQVIRGEARTLRAREQAASLLLYANVRSGIPEQSKSLRALNRIDERERRSRARIKATVRQYSEQLKTRRAAIASNIRTNVLLGLVAGLLVGAIAGAIKPHREGKEVDHFRDYSSGQTYDPSVLSLPLVGAGVALVLAVGLLLVGQTGVLQVMLP